MTVMTTVMAILNPDHATYWPVGGLLIAGFMLWLFNDETKKGGY